LLILDKNKKLDIYKENFYYELNKREQLKIETNYHITFVIVLFSTVSFLTQKFFTLIFDSLIIYLLFVFLILVNFLLLLFSVYYIRKSYHGYDYRLFPLLTKLENYYQELKIFKLLTLDNNVDIDNEFSDYLIRMICENTEINGSINDKRAKFLHKARKFIVWAICFALICSIFFIIGSSFINFNKNVLSYKLINDPVKANFRILKNYEINTEGGN
jgi:hypothetical protein